MRRKGSGLSTDRLSLEALGKMIRHFGLGRCEPNTEQLEKGVKVCLRYVACFVQIFQTVLEPTLAAQP